MENYINPANEDYLLSQMGRKIVRGKTYKETKGQAVENESLWMLGDRGMFKFCAELFSESKYEEFVKQERDLVGYSYWILPRYGSRG